MEHQVLSRAERYSRYRRRKSIWRRLVSFMGCVVVFCTTYALILPAITQEKIVESYCGIAEHSHEEGCYVKTSATDAKTLACTYVSLQVHQHQDACFSSTGSLLCGLADYVFHVHDAQCTDAAGQLICTLPQMETHQHTELCYQTLEGHTHDDACYALERGQLTCELTEEEHLHSEDCYADQGPLVCSYSHVHGEGCYVPGDKLTCTQGHTHSDACYAASQQTVCAYAQEHTHTEACYAYSSQTHCGQEELHTHGSACFSQEQKLLCGVAQEHTHADECYGDGAVICGHEENHAHDGSCYEAESALACTQTPHTHGEACYDGENLTCDAPVHEHADACYAPRRLICTKAEGHAHVQSCREQVLQCQLTVHTHSSDCLAEPELVCTVAEGHVHTDACRELTLQCQLAEHAHASDCFAGPQLICGLDDAHVHTDSCYEPVLACTEGDHTHSDSCYGPRELLCEEAGTPAHGDALSAQPHTHTDACYTSVKTLVCSKPEEETQPVIVCGEAQTHVHSDACFADVQEPLTCQLPEDDVHQHNALCYGEWTLICTQAVHAHELICFSDPTADVETEATWKRTFSHVRLTGIWEMDVLAIAETQLGYRESTRNYIVLEDGQTIRGYTRYGDWFGDPYGEWSTSFAAFCLHYAKVTGMPIKADSQSWINALSRSSAALYHPAGSYDPKAGDLIFFDFDEDQRADHVGIVAKASGTIETIQGDSDNRVRTVTYDRDDRVIVGFGAIPQILNQPPQDEHEHTNDCYDELGSLICEPSGEQEEENEEELLPEEPEEEPAPMVYFCGMEEHIHTNECTDEDGNLLCEIPEHAHTEECLVEHEEEELLPEEPEEEPDPVVYFCGMEEHTHADECMDEEGTLICEIPEHVHTEECLVEHEEEELLPEEPEEEPAPVVYFCGMEEHIHADECMDEEGNLICEIPEHAHTEECLVEPSPVVYFCGMEEHIHTTECMDEDGNLLCEIPEHAHTEECLVEPAPIAYFCGMEEHAHADECMDEEGNLLCEIPEHAHTEECLVEPAPVAYFCGMEEHTHADECMDEEGNLICEIPEHAHTEECLVEHEEEELLPEEPEEEPAPVVYFCGMEEHAHADECTDEDGNLICEIPEHAHTEECLVEPAPVVYFCGMEEHAHADECMDEEGNLICEIPEHAHTEECLVEHEEEELLPEEPEEEPSPVVYFCGMEEHIHTTECTGEEGNLICEIPEHAHTKACLSVRSVAQYFCGIEDHVHTIVCCVDLSHLSDAERSMVEHVILLIEALPYADEIENKSMEFEAAGDYEGEEAWMTQTVKDVLWAYQQYASLPAHLQELVVGREKLLELEFIWSAMTLDIDYVGKTAAFSTDLVLNAQHKIVIYMKYTEETADGGKVERYYAIDYNGNAVPLNIDVNGNITASVSDISTLHWTFTQDEKFYIIQSVAKYNLKMDPMYLHPFDNSTEEKKDANLMTEKPYGCELGVNGGKFTFTGNNDTCYAVLDQTTGKFVPKKKDAGETNIPEYYIGVFKEPVYVGDEVSFSYEALKSPNHFVIYTQDAEGNYYAFDSTGKAVPLFTDGTGRLRADVSDIFSLHWVFSQKEDTQYYIQNVQKKDPEERKYIHPFNNSEDDYGVMTKGQYTSNVAQTDGGFTLEGNGYYAKLNLTSMQFEPTNVPEEASVFHVGHYPICYIWYDGTNGGLMSLEGSLDQEAIFTPGTTISLPATWDSPDKYDYTLRGWYDIISGQYFVRGEEIQVTDHMVLYADWWPTTYDIGQNNDKVSDKARSTSDFITTHVYDYNSLFNMPSLKAECNVGFTQHVENWNLTNTGKEFIFLDYDDKLGHDPISYPRGRDGWNTNHSDVTTGILGNLDGLLDRLFDRDSFDSSTNTGVMGRKHLGTADYLFSYGEDPTDPDYFGYYYYNSRLNAASYNQNDGRFYVYNYLERTTDSSGTGVGGYTDFLPLNSPYANNQEKQTGTYSYDGDNGEYVGTTHYLYDAKGSGSNNATNYWFGMTVDIKFFLPNSPGTTDSEGNYGNQSVYGDDLIFEFAGDDDVWVFVDGKLVLDIGGIHGVRGGDDTINFSKGTVGATVSEVLRNLEPGEHTLTMYYLERGSSQSNCSIRFNICPRYGMRLRKEDVLSGAKLNGAKFAVYTDEACTVAAQLWPNEKAHDNGEPSSNILTVADGEGYIWGFAAGNAYYIKETKGPDEDGYPTPSGIIKMTGNNRGTATFEVLPDDKNELTGGLTVHASSVNHATKEISLTVTNGKNISETTEIYVEKRWEDAKDHTADEVIMSLKADDKIIREQALHNGNDWKFTWTNMPKYHEDGTTEIVYTVVEGEIREYIGRVNKIEPYIATSWQSADAFADGGLFLLKAGNGYLAADESGLKWIAKETTAKASAAALWQATFNGGSADRMVLTNKIGQTLRFDATTPAFYASNRAGGNTELSFNGAHISCDDYTVGSMQENGTMAAEGDSLSFTLVQQTPLAQTTAGFAYRATNRPNTSEETVSLTVKKAWKPGHFGAGLNYDQMIIDVQLLANGVNSGIIRRLSKSNDWQATFTHLREKDDEGQPISYTVKELGLTGPWLPEYGEVFTTEDGYETTITNVCTLTYELPSTGGTGTYPYTLGGILLLAVGALLYIKTKRKEGQRSL